MLQIRLLGQFDIRLDGKRVMIPTRTAQSLFAYLALTAGTPHRREKLAGTFWPNTTDDNARKNLRQELWRIRKSFSAPQFGTDEYLIAEELTIAFNRSAPYWLDVAQLERPEIDLESLTANLALYQGELLPGFYEDWIILERERIQSIFETKMEQLLKQLAAAERWTAVQEQGERWLALGHTPEPAYRAVMLAYGARGDMVKVSSIYQRCIEELREQFGLEPSAETRALYDGLLKGVHAPARSAAVQTAGTVTFLFTDIEESTNLLDKLGDQYASVLAEHHEILRVAIQKWNGYEVAKQGDAFFVTFGRAQDALQCAADAQRGLAAHSWTHNQPPRVRMGLHTGEPLIASTGYVGMDVHRAARIGDAAHGGQVLLSQTTRDLVMHDLPQGLTIRDLGEHRLKDLKSPTLIYQLIIPGLSHDFPPIRTKFTGSEAPTAGEPPFKGLQYFEELDSDLFFGRELLTAKLVNHLSSSQFLSVIIGASGSGKSSLVRAGLIPSLNKGQTLLDGTKPPEGSSEWRVHIITPTAHPLEALAIELTRDSESVTTTSTLMDDLMQDPRSLALFLIRKYPKQHTLLVLDQFEELFTLCRDEFEREAFIDNLLTTLNQGERHVTLVLTLRADFYAHLAQYPELRDAVAKQQEYIGPMTTEELRRAIEEPARRGHWAFEPGLVDLILRDVGDEPGALPLLSHALLETWKRRAGHTLTLKGYADAGGVQGAIAHTAESMYQNLSPAEQAITHNIFLRLTELGEGTEDTRRRTTMAELLSHSDDANEVRAVLNRLAEARLITLGEDTVEVAHEALIREWPTLREWLTQDRAGLLLHRQITEAAHEWELLERDAGSVYRGARLAQAREWAILHPNSLNAGERAFIEASNELEQREQAEREAQIQRELDAAKELAETQSRAAKQLRRRAVFLTGALGLAIVLAVLAIFFGGKANQNAKQAKVERLIATSRELAAAAMSSLEEDPERSILLALKAEATTHTPEAENALHRSILASRTVLVVHNGAPVWDVTFSPDGKRFATTSQDKTAKIWDAKTGQLLLTLIGHTDQVAGIVYSPDGKRIATTSDDHTAKVWDATTGQLLLTLTGHTGAIRRSAFSPDGTRLVTVSLDETVKVWDALTGKELLTFTDPPVSFGDVAFNPDGHRIAISGSDGTVRIWDAATGTESLVLSVASEFGAALLGVAFSPDGKRVALVSDGINPVKIWDAATGEVLLSGNLGHAVPPIDIAFSPDGKLAITGGEDQKAKVWDTTTGQVLYTLSGHTQGIIGVAFSPDGAHVATASSDGTARLWDVTPAKELLFIPFAHPEINWNKWLSYNADGTRIVTDYTDSNARIWDAVSGKELMQLGGFTANTGAVQPSYSPDGKLIAAGNGEDKILVWDAQTGEQRTTLVGFQGWARHIAFSPDGTRLASANDNDGTKASKIVGTVTVWDLDSAKALLTMQVSPHGTTSVAYSPDGKYLLTGDWDANGIIWDANTGNKLFTLPEQSWVTAVSFSPDGELVATGCFNGIVTLWNALTGKKLLTLKGHSGWVNAVPFSPDGKLIATVANDGTARVWDVATGENLLTLPVDTQGVGGVSFSPDGKRLAVGGYSGIYVFTLPIDEVVELAKSRVTRSLTAEECQQYLHVEQCPSKP
jgi:WD40 repeat protein/DNA-binding SARP family transcriptional activator